MVHKTVYNLFVGCFSIRKPFDTAVLQEAVERKIQYNLVKKLTNVNHKKSRMFII